MEILSKEKQINEMAQEICAFCVETCGDCNLIAGKPCESVMVEAEHLYNAGYRKQSEVIEEYRQKVNTKMGKHTHLLGKEYVQRILREVAKEMKGGAE